MPSNSVRSPSASTPTTPPDGTDSLPPSVERGRDALNRLQRRICGRGAVTTAAVAEGLALAGTHATNLLIEVPEDRCPPAHAPRVHHRVRHRDGPPLGSAFELCASTAEEALQLSVLAHRVVRLTGEPGTCSVDASTAQRLAPLTQPSDATLARLLEIEHDPETHVSRALEEAFDVGSTAFGRPLGPLALNLVDETETILVATGEARQRAEAVASALRGWGLRAGSVGVVLREPFPLEAVRSALTGARRAIVLEDDADVPGSLLTEVRAAFAGDDGAPGLWSRSTSCTPREIARAVGHTLPPGSDVVTPAAPTLYVGAAPAGRWGHGLLHALAGEIAWLGPLQAHESERPVSGMSVMGFGPAPVDEDVALSLLVAADVGVLAADRIWRRLKRGARIVVVARDASPERLWAAIPTPYRQLAREREIQLFGFQVEATAQPSEPSAHAAVGPCLHVEPALAAAATGRSMTASSLWEALERAHAAASNAGVGHAAVARLRRQAECTFWVSTSDVAIRPSVVPPPDDLHLPQAEPQPRSTQGLRAYHLSGSAAPHSSSPADALPLWPAGIQAALSAFGNYPRYPLYAALDASGALQGAPEPLCTLVERTLDAMQAAGEAQETLRAHRMRLTQAFAREMSERHLASASLRELAPAALSHFQTAFEATPAAAAELSAQVKRLERRLPTEGSLMGANAATPLRLHLGALVRARQEARGKLEAEVVRLQGAVEAKLQSDALHAPEATRPEALGAAWGDAAGARLDLGRLAQALPAHRGPKRLPEASRRRLEDVVAELRAGRARLAEAAVVLLHALPLPDKLGPLENVRRVEHPAALEVSAGLFDGLAAHHVRFCRALRIARLEEAGQYDADEHDAALSAFDAEALTPAELAVLPAVCVLESAERLRGPAFGALSLLLRSGRPVQVPVLDVAFRVGEDVASSHRTSLAQIAIAHRECFVLQSSLGQPDHLALGLTRLARTGRPAVALFGLPEDGSLLPSATQLAAIDAARAKPCFVYDPDAGATWADRLELTGNLQPERAFVEASLEGVGAQPTSTSLTCRLTLADLAALDPELRHHFLCIAPEAWADDQLPVADYLEAWERNEAAGKLPFVWVLESDGQLGRAIVSRELAFAARDRSRTYRVLAELGGVDNEWARRATEAAEQIAHETGERERAALAVEHERELSRVREHAAGEAMQRLVDVLLDLDRVPATPPGRAPNAAAAPSASPGPEAAARPEASPASSAQDDPHDEDDDDGGFDEPYVDTSLCTTCNECINLNGQLFKYNANKQAEIVDVAAGSYLQLVTAAEKCPSRCIHPGVPRAGDATATPEVVARGERYR